MKDKTTERKMSDLEIIAELLKERKEELCPEFSNGCRVGRQRPNFFNSCIKDYRKCGWKDQPQFSITGIEQIDEMIYGVV
jgi:hypothetical protein